LGALILFLVSWKSPTNQKWEYQKCIFAHNNLRFHHMNPLSQRFPSSTLKPCCMKIPEMLNFTSSTQHAKIGVFFRFLLSSTQLVVYFFPLAVTKCLFMQVVNHGVSSELLQKLKHEIEKFFQLPIEEKKKYQIRAGDVQGYGSVIRCKDQKLDWGDRFYMLINPVERRKPYLLPQLPASLR